MRDCLDLDLALGVALRTAREAGALLRAGHERGFTVEHKGAVDLVTEYDRQSEELVVAALGRAFPGHTVVGEEGSEVRGKESGAVWYVDPLDGTTNYAHRLPFYAVSIALELEGEPAVGVVYAPELGWEFTALRGRGAALGGVPLRVSAVPRLDASLLATGFPYDRRTSTENNVPEFAALLRLSQGVRRVGSAALDCAMVAWGVLDGYWESKVNPWDIAAGALLVLEAGGRVTSIDGAPYRSTGGRILATNGLIHDELRAALKEARR
jgi:myo-inositol-1(or 4)-monophosphatase